MCPPNPSIEAYFLLKSPPLSPLTSSSPIIHTSSSPLPYSDGFTNGEINAILKPNATWTPDKNYEEVSIGDLEPGPRCVALKGRVANFYVQVYSSKRPNAAKGCIRLIIKDDTGALSVRLWFAHAKYNLRLGQLVSVWTPHVSNGERGSLAVVGAPLFASIFPERDKSCHFMVPENSDPGTQYKLPLNYVDGEQLPELMTLKGFMDGGYDLSHARILVCVKGIGARKKVTNKKGKTSDLVKVMLFDDTADASLSLWGAMASSAQSWQPSHTILLITSPGWKIEQKAWLSMSPNTIVDVDPDIPDTAWLRGFAQRMTKREHVNPPFPKDVFDFRTFLSSSTKMLFSLADIDAFARMEDSEPLMGYMSVIILEMHMVKLYRRTHLFCNECCGIPIYTNETTATCKHCDGRVQLNINPRVIGKLIDETGTIETGRAILCERAWEQLLGRTIEELANAEFELLKYLEQRLLFLRVTLLFGWAPEGLGVDRVNGSEVGRLYIAEIRT